MDRSINQSISQSTLSLSLSVCFRFRSANHVMSFHAMPRTLFPVGEEDASSLQRQRQRRWWSKAGRSLQPQSGRRERLETTPAAGDEADAQRSQEPGSGAEERAVRQSNADAR